VGDKKHDFIYRLSNNLYEEINAWRPPQKVPEVVETAHIVQELMISDRRNKVPVAACKCVKGRLRQNLSFRLVTDGEILCNGKF
jgi:translation initiation factor IF-2